MTLKLRLPGGFRRRGGGDSCPHPLPNASDDSKTSTKISLSSGASSSCFSSSYQPRPPLPLVIASNVTPSTSDTIPSNGADRIPANTCALNPSVASFPPPAASPHLPNLVTTSTIIAHGTQPLAASVEKTSRDRRPTLERGGNAGGSACSRRSSWRSTSLGSMRSINEDAELPSDVDFWDNGDGHIDTKSPESRFPHLSSYRTPSNSSLTSVQSCPAATCTRRTASSISASNKNAGSSSPSKRELREEKIRRKSFEARRREFATGNPRRLSNDGSVGSAGSAGSGDDPRLIRRRRQSVDFLRQESQAAAIGGDDDDCYYCHHGDQCLDNYRPRSSSLDDSSDQRVLVEHTPPAGQGRRATMPSDFMSASQTLIDSYYREQARSFSYDEDDSCPWNGGSSSGSIGRQQSPTVTTATSNAHARRSSMPISITEDESDGEYTVENSPSSVNANGNRNDSTIGLLEELEGRGLLKVQNAGLAGALLYYDTEHRRLSL